MVINSTFEPNERHFYLMRIIASIILLFAFTTIAGQGNHPEGLLKIEKVKTYWDKDSTLVRSMGFYNKSGYGSVEREQVFGGFGLKKERLKKRYSIGWDLDTVELNSFIQMGNYWLKDTII